MKQRNRKFRDITGQKIGRLTVQWPVGKNKDNRICWLCSCECGKLKVVSRGSLRSERTKSCGCYSVEVSRKNKWTLKHGKSETIEGRILYSAAARARKSKPPIPFNLTIEDIIIPAVCPLLGVPLLLTDNRKHSPNSPSLDRKIPSLGYVKGNVWVVSVRANMIKSNASLEEMQRLVRNWEKLA